jgi:hypothetical protein
MNYPNGQMIKTMIKSQTKVKLIVGVAEIHRKATIVKFQS